jgi:predicted DNA-binding protein (MmcQ/YjbR family)
VAVNIEYFRDYCLAKVAVSEGFPFDHKTLVFKVGSKMFALTDVDEFVSVNLKCDPERAVDLRENYEGIKPGYHMNKTHWNTVETGSDVPDDLLLELTDLSYQLVARSLTKKERSNLGIDV